MRLKQNQQKTTTTTTITKHKKLFGLKKINNIKIRKKRGHDLNQKKKAPTIIIS